MSKSDTWMPFFVGDYLSATGRLTTEQHGAYLLILLDYWKNGPPPNDDVVLAALARLSPSAWRKAKPALIGFFEAKGGLLIQRRVERERDRATEITEKRSKAGKASAAARSAKQHNGNTEGTSVGTHVATDGLQNGRPSQSQVPLDKESNGADADQIMWEAAKAFLKPERSDPGSLIGKWCKEFGKEATAQAITKAQLERPAQRIPFIVGCLKLGADEFAWDGGA